MNYRLLLLILLLAACSSNAATSPTAAPDADVPEDISASIPDFDGAPPVLAATVTYADGTTFTHEIPYDTESDSNIVTVQGDAYGLDALFSDGENAVAFHLYWPPNLAPGTYDLSFPATRDDADTDAYVIDIGVPESGAGTLTLDANGAEQMSGTASFVVNSEDGPLAVGVRFEDLRVSQRSS